MNQPVKATATDSACPLTTPTITEDVDIASIKSQSKPAPVVVTQSSTPVPSTFFATATSAFAPSNEVLSKQSQLRTQLARQKEQSPVITLSSAQKHWSQPSPIPFSSSNITRQVPANHTLSTSAPQLLLIKPTTIAPVRHIAASAGTPGLFFKRSEVNFGTVEVGTLTRVKIELCNSTNEEVTVFVGDPQLPFVVLHNEVTIRPRCYVKLPVRFLPVVGPKNFSARLVAQSADGSFQATINLSGSSSC